jgi:hypothetical protein
VGLSAIAPFWLFSVSNFLVFGGYMVPFQFLPSYGHLVLGVSQDFSLYVSMVSQASNIVGRLFAGYLTSRIGVMVPWTVCVFASGTIATAWYGASITAGFAIIASLCVCFNGASPPCLFLIHVIDRRAECRR